MKMFCARAAGGLVLGLAMIWLSSPSLAQAPGEPSATPSPAARVTPAPQAEPAPPPSPPATVRSPPVSPDSMRMQTDAAADGAAAPLNLGGHMQRDLSPWSMFLSADLLVKVVIVSLGFASVVTWTIFLAKTVQLSRALRRLRGALMKIAETRTLSEAQSTLGSAETVLSLLLRAAVNEIKMSGNGATDEGIKERASSRFSEIARAEARAMRQGMAILATIGATAPFVGLFGTVWGIMNSFIGISKAQTTNLAVVAPGIAEALLATAVGLVAAIPAVIVYNYFSRTTKGYLELVGRGSGAVGRLLSRDLDRAHGRLMTRAAE
jgi:biopolymer transport protein ExbB